MSAEKKLADRIQEAIKSPENIGVHPRKVFAGLPADWKRVLRALRKYRSSTTTKT